MLDLARWAPPEHPAETKHLPRVNSSIFYRLMRPEFLKRVLGEENIKVPPLSSDTLSNWGKKQDRRHEENLRSATKFLCNDAVERAVRSIMSEADSFDIESTVPADLEDLKVAKFPDTIDVSGHMHQVGLPIRHLLLVHLRKDKHRLLTGHDDEHIFADRAPSLAKAGLVESRIVAEMVARAIKRFVRKWLRGISLADLDRKLSGLLLVDLMGDGTKEARQFYTSTMPEMLHNQFGVDSKIHLPHIHDPIQKEHMDGLIYVATELLHRDWAKIDLWSSSNFNSSEPFGDDFKLTPEVWQKVLSDRWNDQSKFGSTLATATHMEDGENKVGIVDSLCARSWQAMLGRFASPPRFDWETMFISPHVNPICGFRVRLNDGERVQQEENPAQFEPRTPQQQLIGAQLCFRRHCQLILDHALRSNGLHFKSLKNLDALLSWSVSSHANIQLPSSPLLEVKPRLKRMDMFEFAKVETKCRLAVEIVLQAPLPTADQDSKRSASHGEHLPTRYPCTEIEDARRAMRRLRRSGGASKASELAWATLEALANMTKAPWDPDAQKDERFGGQMNVFLGRCHSLQEATPPKPSSPIGADQPRINEFEHRVIKAVSLLCKTVAEMTLTLRQEIRLTQAAGGWPFAGVKELRAPSKLRILELHRGIKEWPVEMFLLKVRASSKPHCPVNNYHQHHHNHHRHV